MERKDKFVKDGKNIMQNESTKYPLFAVIISSPINY